MKFIINPGDACTESAVRKKLNEWERTISGFRFTEKDHKKNLFFDYGVILKSERPFMQINMDEEYEHWANVIVTSEIFKANCNIDLLQQKINDHINLLKTQLQDEIDE
jgi:hypothetical protein